MAAELDLETISDLTWLLDSSDEIVAKTLIQRYRADLIYTNVGPVLIAMNPFKNISGLYDEATMADYFDKKIGFEDNMVRLLDRPSHIFAITSQAYINLCRGRNQSIIISGESGAGKTETTKQALGFLTNVAGTDDIAIKDQLLEFSHILESWGNAKTVRNNNSSRFGKFSEIWFRKAARNRPSITGSSSGGDSLSEETYQGAPVDELLFISGARNTTYLLEKSRVVSHDHKERTFHVFYQYFRGATAMHKRHGLESIVRDMENAKIFVGNLASSARSDLNIPNVNDALDFNVMIQSMKTLSFSEVSIQQCFDIIACIIHLMEIKFDAQNNAVTNIEECLVAPQSLPHIQHICAILNMNSEELKKGLLFRSVVSGKDTILSPLSLVATLETRDTLCKDLYLKTFDFIVKTINLTLDSMNCTTPSTSSSSSPSAKGSAASSSSSSNLFSDSRMMGVLDIFGFEIFEKNSFEQMCINMANETLQQNFNSNIFKRELDLYIAEEVPVPTLAIRDNQDVLDLLTKKPSGIFHLLDEEGIIPKGTDESFLNKIVKAHGSKDSLHPKFSLRVPGKAFLVKHFAGDVTYSISNLLNKNRDGFPVLLVDVMSKAGHSLVKEFYGGSSSASSTSDGKGTPSSPAGGGGGASNSSKKFSLGKKFQIDLDSLMAKIESTQSHFVRCIKPNDEKKPKLVKENIVLEQLIYSGVFEAVVIMKSGYPCKLTTKQFREKFHMLAWKKNVHKRGRGSVITLPDDKLNVLYPERLNRKVKPSLKVVASFDHWQAASKVLMEFMLKNKDLKLEFVESSESCLVGKTIVFYRPAQQHELETLRLTCRKIAATTVQLNWRGYKTRQLLKIAKSNLDQSEAAISKRDLPNLTKYSNNVEESVSKLFALYGVYFAEVERRVLVKMTASLNNEKRWETKFGDAVTKTTEVTMTAVIEDLLSLREQMARELNETFKYRGRTVVILWSQNNLLKGLYDKIDRIAAVVLLKAKFEDALKISDEVEVENLLTGFDKIVAPSERNLTTDFKNRAIKFVEVAARTFSDFLSLVEEPAIGRQNVLVIVSASKQFSGSGALKITGNPSPLRGALKSWEDSVETFPRFSVRSTKAINIFTYMLQLRSLVIEKDFVSCWKLLHLSVEKFNTKIQSGKYVSLLIGAAMTSAEYAPDDYDKEFNKDAEVANSLIFYQGISDLNILPPVVKQTVETELQSIKRMCLYNLVGDVLLYSMHNETLPNIVEEGFASECFFKKIEFLINRLDAYKVGWDKGSSETATFDDELVHDVYTTAMEHLSLRKTVFLQDFDVLQTTLRSVKKVSHDHADFHHAYSFMLFNLLRIDMCDVFKNEKDGNNFEEILKKYTTTPSCDAEWKKNVKCMETILPLRYLVSQRMYNEANDFMRNRPEFFNLDKDYQLLNTINISKKVGFIKGGSDLFKESLEEFNQIKKNVAHELALLALAAACATGQVTGVPGNINFNQVNVEVLEDTIKKVEHDLIIDGCDAKDATSPLALLISCKDLLTLRKLLHSLRVGAINGWGSIKEFIFESYKKYMSSFQNCHRLCKPEFYLIYDETIEMDIQTDIRMALSSSPLQLNEKNGYEATCDLSSLTKVMEVIEEIEKRKNFSTKLRSIVFTGKLMFTLRYAVVNSLWEGVAYSGPYSSSSSSSSAVGGGDSRTSQGENDYDTVSGAKDSLHRDVFSFVSQPLSTVFERFESTGLCDKLFFASGDRKSQYLNEALKLFETLDQFSLEKQNLFKAYLFTTEKNNSVVGTDKTSAQGLICPSTFVVTNHVYDIVHFFTKMESLAPPNIAKILLDDTVADIVKREFETVAEHCKLRKAYINLLMTSSTNQIGGPLSAPQMKFVTSTNTSLALAFAKNLKAGGAGGAGGVVGDDATTAANYWNLPLWVEGVELISNLRTAMIKYSSGESGVDSRSGTGNFWMQELMKEFPLETLENSIAKLESCQAFPLLELKFVLAKIHDIDTASVLFESISEFSRVVGNERIFDSKLLVKAAEAAKEKHSKWLKRLKMEAYSISNSDSSIFTESSSCYMALLKIVEILISILDKIKLENESKDVKNSRGNMEDDARELMISLKEQMAAHTAKYAPSPDHLIIIRRVSGEIFRLRLLKEVWRLAQTACVQGLVMQLEFHGASERITDVSGNVRGWDNWVRDFTDADDSHAVDKVTETAIELSKSYLKFLTRIQGLNLIFNRFIDTQVFVARRDNTFYDKSTGKDVNIIDVVDIAKMMRTATVTVSSLAIPKSYRMIVEDWKALHETYLEIKTRMLFLQSNHFQSEVISSYIKLLGIENSSRVFVVESLDFLTDFLQKPSSNTALKNASYVYNKILENSENCRQNAKRAGEILVKFWTELKEFGNETQFRWSNFVSSMLFSMIFLHKVLLAKCNGWIEQFDRNWAKVSTPDFALFDVNDFEFSDSGISTLIGLNSIEENLLSKKFSVQSCVRDFLKIFNSSNKSKHLFISHPLINLFAVSCVYFIEDEVTNLELNRVILNDDVTGSVGMLRFTPLVSVPNTKHYPIAIFAAQTNRNKYAHDSIELTSVIESLTAATTIANSSKVTFEVAMKRCETIGYLKPDLKLLVESVDINLHLRKYVFFKKYEDGFYCLKDYLISNKFLAGGGGEYNSYDANANILAKEKLFMDVVLCLLNKDYFFVIRSLYKDFISLATELCDGFWRKIIFDTVLKEAVTGNRIRLQFPLFYYEDTIVMESDKLLRCLNRMKNISKHSYGLQTILTHLYDLRRSIFASFCKIEKVYKLCDDDDEDDDDDGLEEYSTDTDSDNYNPDLNGDGVIDQEEKAKLWIVISDEIKSLRHTYFDISSLTDITNEVVEENCDTEDMLVIKKHVLSEIKLIRDYISFHFVSFDLELMLTSPLFKIRKQDGLMQYFVPKSVMNTCISTSIALNYNKFGDNREIQMLFLCKLMSMVLDIITTVSGDASSDSPKKKKSQKDEDKKYSSHKELIFGLNAIKYPDLEAKIMACSRLFLENESMFNLFHTSSSHLQDTLNAMSIACLELRNQQAMIAWLSSNELFIENAKLVAAKSKGASSTPKGSSPLKVFTSNFSNEADEIFDGFPIVLKRKNANGIAGNDIVSRVHEKSVEIFLKTSYESFKAMKVITEVGNDVKAWILLEIEAISHCAIKENWQHLKVIDPRISSNNFFNRDISSLPMLYRHMNTVEYLRSMKHFIFSFAWNIPIMVGWTTNKPLCNEVNNDLIRSQEALLTASAGNYQKAMSRTFTYGPSAHNSTITSAAVSATLEGKTKDAAYDDVIRSSLECLSSICYQLKEIVTTVRDGTFDREMTESEELSEVDYVSAEKFTNELSLKLKTFVASSKSKISDDISKLLMEVIERYSSEVVFLKVERKCNSVFRDIRLQILDENVVLPKSWHTGIYEIMDTLRINPDYLNRTLPMLQLLQGTNILSFILNMFSRRKISDDDENDDAEDGVNIESLTEALYVLNIAASKSSFDEKTIFLDMRAEFENSLFSYQSSNKKEGIVNISDQEWQILTSSTASEAELTSQSWQEVIMNTDSYAEIPISEPSEDSDLYVYFHSQEAVLEEFTMSRNMMSILQTMEIPVGSKEELLRRILPIRSESIITELSVLEKYVVSRHFKRLFYDLLRSSNMSNVRSSTQYGPILANLKQKYSNFEDIDGSYQEEVIIQMLLHFYTAQRKPFYWRKDLMDYFFTTALRQRLAFRYYDDALKRYKTDYQNRQQNKVNAEKSEDFNIDEQQLTKKLEVESKITRSLDKLSQFYSMSKANTKPRTDIHGLIRELTSSGLSDSGSGRLGDSVREGRFSAREFFDSALRSSSSLTSSPRGGSGGEGSNGFANTKGSSYSSSSKVPSGTGLSAAELTSTRGISIQLFDESVGNKNIVSSPYKNRSYDAGSKVVSRSNEVEEEKARTFPTDSLSPSKKLEYLASHGSKTGSSAKNNSKLANLQRTNSEDLNRVQNKLSIISSPLFNPPSHPPTNASVASGSVSSTSSGGGGGGDSSGGGRVVHSSGVNLAAALFGSPSAKFPSFDFKKKANNSK